MQASERGSEFLYSPRISGLTTLPRLPPGGVFRPTRKLPLLLLDLLSAFARLLGPGGAEALVAENPLTKQQLPPSRTIATASSGSDAT